MMVEVVVLVEVAGGLPPKQHAADGPANPEWQRICQAGSMICWNAQAFVVFMPWQVALTACA